MVWTEEMVFRRRGNRLGTQIHSIKHVIDATGALVQGAGIVSVPLATAVISRQTPFQPVEVEVGETVNGFFISIFIIGSSGADVEGSQDWLIVKTRSGQADPVPGLTGVSDIRNQIFHEEKGLVASGDGTPMVFKGVIVVPKSMRRMREGDKINIVLLNRSQTASNDTQFCLKAIYKSFS